jgi:hypothetical protein
MDVKGILAGLGALTLAAPAAAQTIVFLPEPGSMAAPTVVMGEDRNSDLLYVCPPASSMSGCTVSRNKKRPVRR